MCIKKKEKKFNTPGIVVIHTCNPSSRTWRQEDREFDSNLCYIGRPCLKKDEEGRKESLRSNPRIAKKKKRSEGRIGKQRKRKKTIGKLLLR
jgi:hypothetical protein